MRRLSRAVGVIVATIVASSCGSTPVPPATPTISTSIASPRPLSPINNQQVETRPWLIVENALAGNLSAIRTYRFDVSPSPTFDRGLISTTVLEGNPGSGSSTRTYVLIPTELSLDTHYYWRVQVIDVVNGVASPFMPTTEFSTFGPRPGLSLLHVSMLPACQSGIGATFDGMLTSDGLGARFVAQLSSERGPPLTIELSRTSSGWSGHIFGVGYGREAKRMEILPDGAALEVRGTEMSGRWTGTFAGDIGIWDRFGDGGTCSDQYVWVILTG